MIVVKRETDLETTEWRFFYYDSEHVLMLTSSRTSTRPSRRHKFKAAREWRSRERDGAPIVPPDVPDEARRAFVETLKVVA
jgi:hypothetical protein